ncbi:hypothetical protein [Ruminococcus sp.]|jgi:hypothetical protein|uniref:hypothetical protein n=1 Tax=Ruminococcus TaxID=1263 RepID=UPI00352243D0
MKKMEWERVYYKGKYQFIAYNTNDCIVIETGVDVSDDVSNKNLWQKITDSFPSACSYRSFLRAFKEAKLERKLYGKYERCA